MPEEALPPVPLWKQLAGAVGGSLLALTLYTAYTWAKPVVTGYILRPGDEIAEVAEQSQVRFSDTDEYRTDRAARVAMHARELSQTLLAAAAQQAAQDEVVAAPAEDVTPAWTEVVPSESPIETAWNPAPSESIPEPAPEPVPSPVAARAPSVLPSHSGAPDLPNSGPGVVIAVMVAGAVAGVKRARRKTRANDA